MRPARKRRVYLVALIVLGVSGATALALTAFNQNIMYYYTPTDVVEGKAPKDRAFRTGGLVKSGSLKRENDGVTVHFVDEGEDTGPIILQQAVAVEAGMDLASLEQEIHRVEHKLLPSAVRLFAQGKLRVAGSKVLLQADSAC